MKLVSIYTSQTRFIISSIDFKHIRKKRTNKKNRDERRQNLIDFKPCCDNSMNHCFFPCSGQMYKFRHIRIVLLPGNS